MSRYNPAFGLPPNVTPGSPLGPSYRNDQAAGPVPEQSSSSLASAMGCVYLFFLFGHSVEFIDSTGRLHLMIILAVIGLGAAVTGGTLPRAFGSPIGVFLTCFTMLLVLGIPFSTWKGGSFSNFTDLWLKSYLTFFLVSGLIFNLQQLRRALLVVASASVGITYLAAQSSRTYNDGRLSVEYGSLGNSNDLAGALLICLPFVIYVVTDKKRLAITRLAFLASAGFSLMTIIKTGSRASIPVIFLMSAILFFKVKAPDKMKLLAFVVVALCATPFFLSKDLIARYSTIFSSQETSEMSDTASSAVQSTSARKELQKNALVLTMHHPIFGVGLGNFSYQNANLMIASGQPPLPYTCHNIYLLVASETGILAFCFYVAVIISSARMLMRLQKAAANSPELKPASAMALCLFMSLFAFAACGFFGTNAYGLQMPGIVALAFALDRVCRPILTQSEQKRMQHFRASIPVTVNKFADGLVLRRPSL